jgi:hypothetical protein
MNTKIFGAPSSVLTRPNNTTAYAQNDLIASSATAGSIVVPSFVLPRDKDAFSVTIKRGRLYTNLTTGFTTFQGHIDLWNKTPPTFTNGDNGAYAVATGSAGWIGHLTTEVSNAYAAGADGAFLSALIGSGTATDDYTRESIRFARTPGDKIYWSLREVDSTGFTPIANQTFTLVLELYQGIAR